MIAFFYRLSKHTNHSRMLVSKYLVSSCGILMAMSVKSTLSESTFLTGNINTSIWMVSLLFCHHKVDCSYPSPFRVLVLYIALLFKIVQSIIDSLSLRSFTSQILWPQTASVPIFYYQVKAVIGMSPSDLSSIQNLNEVCHRLICKVISQIMQQ